MVILADDESLGESTRLEATAAARREADNHRATEATQGRVIRASRGGVRQTSAPISCGRHGMTAHNYLGLFEWSSTRLPH